MSKHDMSFPEETRGTIVLGVASSDAHAVANQLIDYSLRGEGYEVVNLGTCTSVSEFAEALAQHTDVLAMVVGSLNGHVHEDLRDLPAARRSGAISCPVVVGGNLSVGSQKDESAVRRLYELGVDYVLGGAHELIPLLDELSTSGAVARAA